VRFTKYYYGDQIKEDEMCGKCRTNGRDEKCLKILVGKTEGRRTRKTRGIPRSRWEKVL